MCSADTRIPATDGAIESREDEYGSAGFRTVRNGKRRSLIGDCDVKHGTCRRAHRAASGRRNGHDKPQFLASASVESGFTRSVVADPKGSSIWKYRRPVRTSKAPAIDQICILPVSNQRCEFILPECQCGKKE